MPPETTGNDEGFWVAVCFGPEAVNRVLHY